MNFSLDHSIDVLARTPVVLRAMLGGASDAWTRATEGEGTWSPFDVVGHLIDGERTDWIPRARIILAPGSGSRRFEPYDRFAHLRSADRDTLAERLDSFERLRTENLAELRGFALTPADLERGGEHPALGPVTLGQLLATWTAHDLDHLVQIARTMARQYTEAAGPWRAYLRVLRNDGTGG